MKLWLLKAIGTVDYDSYDGFVIRANTAEEARAVASRNPGDEGPGTWLDGTTSTCEALSDDGDPGIVLGSYCAG